MYDVVEVCPWCGSENYYPDYDVEGNNYRAKCKTCGKEIMLCDECLHSDDNKCGHGNWHEKEYYMRNRIKVVGICHRNITHNDIYFFKGESMSNKLMHQKMQESTVNYNNDRKRR